MKNIFFLTISAFLFNSCGLVNCTEGTGAMATKTFNQEEFKKFVLEASGDVELIPGDKNMIEVTTYENLFEKLNIRNNGSTVDFGFKGCTRMAVPPKVKVYFTRLNEVDIDGSGTIRSQGTIRGEDFNITINGAGNTQIFVDVKNLEATIQGSGEIELRGRTEEMALEINGSGNIRTTELFSGKTSVDINGSGDAFLNNCDNLKTNINGSGNVDCSGKK